MYGRPSTLWYTADAGRLNVLSESGDAAFLPVGRTCSTLHPLLFREAVPEPVKAATFTQVTSFSIVLQPDGDGFVGQSR